MDDVRKGQIAFAYLKRQFLEEARSSLDCQRQASNISKAIDIPLEEAMKFVEIVTTEMVVDEALTSIIGKPRSS